MAAVMDSPICTQAPTTQNYLGQKIFASLLKKKTAEDSKIKKGTAILIAGISTGI